jgi:hypothetical protein
MSLGKLLLWFNKTMHQPELNRTEGYEVLGFINRFGENHWSQTPSLAIYHKIEKMIRYNVPSNIRTHKGITDWIVSNWE